MFENIYNFAIINYLGLLTLPEMWGKWKFPNLDGLITVFGGIKDPIIAILLNYRFVMPVRYRA